VKIPWTAAAGWGSLALLGGGEFSFGETEDADAAWLAKAPPGPIGFIPAASGSTDYVRHFGEYLAETFERPIEVIPIYRSRDARRPRNCERIAACAAVYIGGGVADHLVEALADSPALAALATKLAQGGIVAAIAAAAQACGGCFRSLVGGRVQSGFGWIDGLIEANFDPDHDRRLRTQLRGAGGPWALGIPSGGAVLLGAGEAVETVGPVFLLSAAEAEFEVIGEEPEES